MVLFFEVLELAMAAAEGEEVGGKKRGGFSVRDLLVQSTSSRHLGRQQNREQQLEQRHRQQLVEAGGVFSSK